MYGFRRNEPEPPKRTVWADETKQKLDAIERKRSELAIEERMVKQLCNHTYPNGASAMTTTHDDDPYGPDSGPVTYCTICRN
jgi:hypothetical protein